jgi:hypothetical protein
MDCTRYLASNDDPWLDFWQWWSGRTPANETNTAPLGHANAANAITPNATDTNPLSHAIAITIAIANANLFK